MRSQVVWLALVPCLLQPCPAPAAWTDIGPPGGVAFDIAVSPADPQVIWAVTDWALFRSTDAGATWRKASAEWSDLRWRARLALDPLDAATAFLCVRGEALLRTTDGGATWEDSNPFAEAFAVATVPGAEPFTVLAAGDPQALARSSDLGETWETVTGLVYPRAPWDPVEQLLPMAVDSGVVYASLPYRLCRSEDSGATWWCTYVSELAGSGGVVGHPAEPRTVYAVGFLLSSTRRSDDGGGHWQTLSGAPRATVHGWAFDPVDPATVYAATREGLYRSGDRGASWVRDDGFGELEWLEAVAVDPSDPRVLVVGGTLDPPGIWRTTDHGATWATSAEGLPGARVWSVTVEPEAGGAIYSAGARLDRSRDRGATWETPLHRPVASVALDPHTPGTLWAAVGWSGLLLSTDAGGSWSAGSDQRADWVAVDPHRAGTMYVGDSGWLYRSDDGGATWAFLQLPLTGPEWARVVTHPRVGGALLATGFGLARSWDWGDTWERVSGLPSPPGGPPCYWLTECAVFDVAVEPTWPHTVIVATECGLYASDDWGATWRPSGEGLPPVTCSLNTWGCTECEGPELVEANPVRPGMLVVLAGDELYSSHDHGATWRALAVAGFHGPGHVRASGLVDRLKLTADGNGLLVGTDAGLYALWLDHPRSVRGRLR